MKSIGRKNLTYKEGDRTRSMCKTCGRVTVHTFKTSVLRVKNVSISGVLMEFCNQCGNYVSLPPQSVENIKKMVSR